MKQKLFMNVLKWKYRLAMTILAFPLAIVAGVLARQIDVGLALARSHAPWWWWTNFGSQILFFLVSVVGLLILPPIGFVWGWRIDLAARKSKFSDETVLVQNGK